MKTIFYIFLFFISCNLLSQKNEADSLNNAIQTTKNDTLRVKALIKYATLLQYNYPDSVTEILNKTNALATKINYEMGMAQSNHMLGWCYYFRGNYPVALDLHFKELKLWDKMEQTSNEKRKRYVIRSKSLAFNSIGNVYYEIKEYKKALENYFKGLESARSVDYKDEIVANLGNIGIVYDAQNENEKAKKYYTEALKLYQELNDAGGIGNALGNLGGLLYKNKDYAGALEYYSKSLKLFEKIDLKYGIAVNLTNVGSIYLDQNRPDEARIQFEKALQLAVELENLDEIKILNEFLSKVYEKKGDWKKALKYYKIFILSRDSLVNEDNTKKTVRLEMNFEFDKKEASAKLEDEKKEAIAIAESKKQKIIIWSVSGILVLVFGFAIFAYRSFLQKQKANLEILKQKAIIEIKQKEILDSIHYAKRIQNALMASEKYIDKSLSKLNS